MKNWIKANGIKGVENDSDPREEIRKRDHLEEDEQGRNQKEEDRFGDRQDENRFCKEEECMKG